MMNKAKTYNKSSVIDDSYHELFNGVNDMILVHDPETGAVLDANSKCLEIGYTVDEIRRMEVAGFSTDKEAYSPDRIMPLIRKAAEGHPQLFEWGFCDRVGKYHPTEVSLKRATIRGRNVVLTIIRDISERKAAQQESRHAKDSFHNIVEKSTDGLIVMDDEGIVRFANPSAIRFFSLDKNDLAGSRLDPAIKNKKSAELGITRLNGEPGTGEMRKTKTEWEGKSAYLISIRDITAQKKLVEELTLAISSIRTLRGLLPICSHCKKIRNDKGYWEQIETYISKHSEAEFTHGLCPECTEKYYTLGDDRHETGSLFP